MGNASSSEEEASPRGAKAKGGAACCASPPPRQKAMPVLKIEGWKDVYMVTELLDTDLHYIIHSKQAPDPPPLSRFVPPPTKTGPRHSARPLARRSLTRRQPQGRCCPSTNSNRLY